jgi:GNAT superfamily N-acetyltransferase
MGPSGQQKERDDSEESSDATAVRIKGNNVEVVLDDLFYLKPLRPDAAEVVLWAHRTDFDPSEHWYEYFMGAATEGAEIMGLQFPTLGEYGGFVEVFRWDEGMALESLYILSPFRQRGVGTATVKALEAECKNRLSIWASRVTSPFYERLGYRRDTRQGGWIMTKNNYPGRTFTQAASQYWRSNG